MLSSYGKLSIAIIVFYALALPACIIVCMRHGFGRHAGWFYLLSMAIVRLVGAALRLAFDYYPSTGLFIAASLFFSLGLIPLILCLNGIVKRINDGLERSHLPPRLFQLAHLITLVGLILGIVAGSQSGSTDPGTQDNIKTERKASSILLLIAILINSVMAISFFARLRSVFSKDRLLLFCGVASIPFLLIRVLYSILIAFDSSNPKFNPRNPDIYVEAFMLILMEMICFSLFLFAALFTPPTTANDHNYGRGSQLLPKDREGTAYAPGRTTYQSNVVPVEERV